MTNGKQQTSAGAGTFDFEGDTWRVVSKGVERDGEVFCHLASTTRGKQQPNGWYPAQINTWVPVGMLP